MEYRPLQRNRVKQHKHSTKIRRPDCQVEDLREIVPEQRLSSTSL